LQESSSAAGVSAKDAESEDAARGDIDLLDSALLLRIVATLIPDGEVNPALVEQHLRSVIVRAVGCPVRPAERDRLANGRVGGQAGYRVHPRVARASVVAALNQDRALGQRDDAVAVYLLIPLVRVIKGVDG
jgi:hypothetical protein